MRIANLLTNFDFQLVESQSWPTFQGAPLPFIVFDTSALLGDFNVLRLAMSLGMYFSLIFMYFSFYIRLFQRVKICHGLQVRLPVLSLMSLFRSWTR